MSTQTVARRLTDRYIQSLKPPATGRLVVADAAVEGLNLRITAKGARSWLVRYRPRQRPQRGAVLGPYPVIKLADARRRATEIVSAAKKGIDLLEEEAKQAATLKRAKARARLIRDICDEFLKGCEKLKSFRQRKSYMKNHVLPAIGNRVVEDIRRADIVELLDELEHKRGLRQTTNRVRETLLAFFEYAVERELIEENPVARTKRRKVENQRQRVLSGDEIKALWDGLDNLPAPIPAFVRTLMLTGCRRENARTMRWAELDLGNRVWTIPGSKSKSARPYEIPLSRPMVAMLERLERNGPYVFTRDGQRPIAGMADSKARLDSASGVTGWRMHDLRRTLRTGLARLGIVEEIAERAIGHSRSKLEQTYNVHEYRNEKAEALQRWADHVMGIVMAEPAKVVPLRPDAA